jgi:hypothetical protein
MTRLTRIGIVFAGLVSAAAGLRAAGAGSEGQDYSITVLVDGVAAPEYAARGRIYVEALKGREFTIRIANPTGERVAVALSVDGRNVVDAGRTTAIAAAKWILGPYQTAEIPGWQVSGQTSRKFFFTDTSRSYAKWLGDTANVGTIEAVFFRERPRPPVAASKDEALSRRERAQAAVDEAESGAAGSAGAEGRTAQSAPPSDTRRKAAAKEAESFAATGIGRETSFPVQWVAFDEDPRPAARVAIRYEFHDQLVRLGVLPREDDLYARENASGFEHRYAPDPYRHR